MTDRHVENFFVFEKDQPVTHFSLWWDNITYEMYITVSDNIQRKAFFAHPDTLREIADKFYDWADLLEAADDEAREKRRDEINPYGLDTDDNWKPE